MSYNSKYKGSEVEELLDSIGNKVDKIEGKQLSTEDFTTLLKQKLDGLSNYDDTSIQESVSKLRTDLDTLVSGDTTTAIKTFNEVIAFLDGLEDTEDLASIIVSIEQQIAAKQDVITDLATIREGAALGATALQEVPSGYAKTSDLSVVSTGRTESTTGTMAIKEGYSYRHKLVCDAITDPNSFVEVFFNETYAANGNFAPFCQAGNGVVYIWSKSRDIDNNIEAVLRITPFIGPNGRTNAVSSVFAKKSDLTTKQDTLVSGTNIKTINGESILGSGNIVIEGGSGGSSSSGAYAEVNHGTSDTTLTLTPNTFHVWDEVASLDLSFGAETSGVANEYLFQFTSGATATTLTLPSDIKWANDTAPTISENMIYQISVLKGLASVLEFSNAVALIENKATISNGMMQCTVTFAYPVASEITVNVRSSDGPAAGVFSTGDQTKTITLLGPSEAHIESLTPSVDSMYIYTF